MNFSLSSFDKFRITTFSNMNNKAYPPNCNRKKVEDISTIVGKATVSGGTNLIKLGFFHGKTGAKPEYTHFRQYMKAYAQARKESLLEKANGSEQ